MRKLLIIALAFILSACSATSQLNVQQPIQSLEGYDSMTVVVEKGDSLYKTKGFEKIKTNLIQAIRSKIPSRTNMTYQNDQSLADLLVRVEILSLKYVSQAARVAGGVMAGRAVLNTNVILSDNKTGNTLGQMRTYASSRQGQGIFSGSTTTQVEALSGQIVDEIKKHR